jgi:hypothetical protein
MEAKGRFGKQDFVYLSDEDVYRCPAGEKLKYHYTRGRAAATAPIGRHATVDEDGQYSFAVAL